jgi:hypothetical protein
MASENYILLERTELNASAASVTFANIPQTGYTDLKIVASARSDRADTSDNAIISFNGLTTNLSYRYVQGNGASATSSSGSTGYVGSIDGSTATSSTFGNAEYYIPNYTSSNYKSVSSDAVDETNATTAYATLTAQLWSNTAAITSINLKPQVGSNFLANSTFSLYGIAALGTTPAIAPKASGGNIIDYDGTYWIHTFTSSGTFTPQTGLTCDVLVVAGGGGVYWDAINLTPTWNGGGGAGGFRTATGQSVAAINYAVTVGGGGARGTSPGKGANSVFSSITATGGGGGAFENAAAGSAGGSGGGGGGSSNGAGGTGNQGGFSPAEGNNGGTGGSTFGGSGGGSSAAGATGSSNGVAGGAGTSNSYSGSAVTYAAGGAGGNSVTGNGTANRGNGANATGNGGSGIVIIRYPA